MKITHEKVLDPYTFKPLMGISIDEKPALKIYWDGLIQDDKTFSDVWEEIRKSIISVELGMNLE